MRDSPFKSPENSLFLLDLPLASSAHENSGLDAPLLLQLMPWRIIRVKARNFLL